MTRNRSHDRAFWDAVGQWVPDYEARRARLKELGAELDLVVKRETREGNATCAISAPSCIPTSTGPLGRTRQASPDRAETTSSFHIVA